MPPPRPYLVVLEVAVLRHLLDKLREPGVRCVRDVELAVGQLAHPVLILGWIATGHSGRPKTAQVCTSVSTAPPYVYGIW